ncbi:hypothetical protein HK098_001701 [Nowakowskiella sp. JEL0407]|nr:hypothetical protein HK098_001701 [Nowakowskiella sp. JEL0407]
MLLYHSEEREMLPLLVDQGIACIPWSPLARGVLSGKKKGQTIRSTSDINRDRFLSNQNNQDDIIVERVVNIAERMTKENELNKDGVIRKIISPAMVALAWIYSKKVVTAPIVGIGKEEYLNDALEALKLKLSEDDVNHLEEPMSDEFGDSFFDGIDLDQLEVEAYATSTANPPIRSRVNPSRPSSSNSNFVQQLKTFSTTKQNTPVITSVQNSNSIFKNKESQSNINPKGPNSLFRTDNLDFITEDDEPDTAFQSIHRLDNEALKTWIYPLNYGTVREYQESIVSKALFSNTLVALPTELGKKFIAAVVMYNYYRWFPDGKIIFMAPTKPLVNQQISACYSITGIPDEDMITLTETARILENQKSIYVTPQSIQNDLKNEICPGSSIVLLVVDEAHRATGNHSYTEVVRYLVGADAQFRVLALTATPGSDLDSVQQVITNLRISNIELRTEESMDLQKYTHLRKKDVVVVDMSPEIQQLSKLYVDAANPYLQALVNHKAHYETDPTVFTRFKLITSREKFRKTARSQLADSLIAKLEGYFGVLMSLSSAYNLLIQHGIKTFAGAINNYIEECKANSSKARKDK